ncbi:aminotransferase [Prosthecomicrobium pneumaticum]|uniref:aspartate transaminase n=1 Tax=Prosthecomicrobium pneumaticum TaxID=81895 RepID=A0A7W9FP91_9HYPH|nr:aminotransferase [Prosthecomicrobium pneumaticum]MBB5754369.1 aspartate/methionine/tyrosine aminotransferase [Prosthecomicrobium pneumaticum]
MTNRTFGALGITVFEAMSRLAAAHGAVNLGQGFPEGLEPRAVVEAAAAALLEGPHQYPPMRGVPELRRAVAENGARFFGIEADWESEVLVTSGATEALAAAFFALLNPGDEAIILEPAYDSYAPIIERAGATVVPVRLVAPDWTLPKAALEAAVTAHTRLIVVNTPMNPTGKVFSAEELAWLAAFLVRHDLVAVCDEVYEHLTFDGTRHASLFGLPSARARTVRIGSAGKSFSMTGWKVGYITAERALIEPIARAHQYLTFTTPPALQRAVAAGLALDAAYFDGLRGALQERRDFLAAGLAEAGFDVLPCSGAYFLNIDISAFDAAGDDQAFAERLVREAGVATIPLSAFYRDKATTGLVRLCFAKHRATLEEAIARLGRWRDGAALKAAE